jgi:hypothetical protein
MVDIYFGLIFLIGVLLQLFCGNLGIYLPVAAILVFYAATAAGLVRGLVYSIFFGIIVDIFTGWSLPWNTFAYLAIVLFARFWCGRQALRPAVVNFFPGMAAAAIQLLMILPGKMSGGGSWHFLLGVWLPIFAVGIVFGAVSLPLAVAALDYLSSRLKLPRYQDACRYPEPRKSRWRP